MWARGECVCASGVLHRGRGQSENEMIREIVHATLFCSSSFIHVAPSPLLSSFLKGVFLFFTYRGVHTLFSGQKN